MCVVLTILHRTIALHCTCHFSPFQTKNRSQPTSTAAPLTHADTVRHSRTFFAQHLGNRLFMLRYLFAHVSAANADRFRVRRRRSECVYVSDGTPKRCARSPAWWCVLGLGGLSALTKGGSTGLGTERVARVADGKGTGKSQPTVHNRC